MILFTIYDLFTKLLYYEDGRITPKYKNEYENQVAWSAEAVEYTDCISAEG